MNKICASLEYCNYRTIGNGFYGCNYCGYCDFQRPRDSRSISLNINSTYDSCNPTINHTSEE